MSSCTNQPPCPPARTSLKSTSSPPSLYVTLHQSTSLSPSTYITQVYLLAPQFILLNKIYPVHHSSALVVKRRLRCLVRFVLERSVWHGIRQYPAAYNLTVVGSGCPAMDEIIHAGISVRQLHRLQCFELDTRNSSSSAITRVALSTRVPR